MNSCPAEPGLGTLLRAISDQLDRGSEEHYRAVEIPTRARYTPVVRALGDGALTVATLQSQVGVTQGAMSQTLSLMERDGLVSREQGSNRRSRSISLTNFRQGVEDHAERGWDRQVQQMPANGTFGRRPLGSYSWLPQLIWWAPLVHTLQGALVPSRAVTTNKVDRIGQAWPDDISSSNQPET